MPILEHEYHPVDYRNVCDLRKVSYAARALYLELFCAAGKTKHGVVDVRPALLEDESGIPASQIPALVVELVTAGLIAHDAKNRLAYHVGSALRHCYNDNMRTGWRKVAASLPMGPARLAFETEIAGVAWQSETVSEPYRNGMDTVSEPYANRFDNGNGNGNKNGNEEPAVAKATATLALPDVTRSALPMEQEPQADEIDPFANQPDPWANIKPTVIDEVDLDYRPEPKLTPEAKARVDAARQQTLTLTAPKPVKRELTPAQLDAIFAQKMLRRTVDYWNEVMAIDNAPCDFKAVAAKATTLMGNFAKYKHRDLFDDARCMFGWATAVGNYHGGGPSKQWSLQAWLSAEHLSLVFAAYRAHKGDAKQLTMDLDRTLRDWRLEVEAGELNNKLAAAKNEAA